MGETRFIIAGNLIDGSGAAVQKNVFLQVQNRIIAAIGSAAHLSSFNGAVVDNFSHCTVLPALVDCSVTLSMSPAVNIKERLATEEAGLSKKTAILARHIRYCHIHGVLGVADSDDPSGLVESFKVEGSLQGLVDIRTSGRLCRSREDRTSGELAANDFLKVGYSVNIEDGQTTNSRLGPEDLCRILENRGARKAVVVANGPQPVKDALAAGCDAIEQGYAMGEENLRLMAAKGVLWIPGVLRAKNALSTAGASGDVGCRFSLGYVAPGKPAPGAVAYWKKMLAEQLLQLRLARKLGVLTAVGTGAGSVGLLHGESMAEEMKLFIKAGYSLTETIRCASQNGAEFFSLEKLGQLTAGRNANFLITRGSVQQLPRKLSYLEGIYVDGQPSSIYHKNPVRPA
ncbi:MAG: amidohydrolase family protein [Desulfobulbales bacterium]|nr:amidohydrolase family protein [Desulfobulbales bacterium]